MAKSPSSSNPATPRRAARERDEVAIAAGAEAPIESTLSIGSHLSVAGGMHLAIDQAVALGLQCVQVFTKNQQQWSAPPLKPEAIALWNDALRRAGWASGTGGAGGAAPGRKVHGAQPPHRVTSHASYLINLASGNDELWRKSIDLMVEEINRCEALSIPLLVSHPGSSTGRPKSEGITRIADAYREIFKRTKGARTISCLEATVGAGSIIGSTFEELATLRGEIIGRTGEPDRVGFCIDTCHIHAAGYNLASAEAARAIAQRMDDVLGLAHVHCLHLNDSLGAAGSNKDRHAHIGRGTIHPEAFGALLAHPVLGKRPALMETPKESGGPGTEGPTAWDVLNANNLRRLAAGQPLGTLPPAPEAKAAPPAKKPTDGNSSAKGKGPPSKGLARKMPPAKKAPANKPVSSSAPRKSSTGKSATDRGSRGSSR